MGSRKVEVNVKFSDKTYQGVTGRTRIVLYQGKKKVKTWTSNAQVPVRVWTGKTKAAVKTKYKVVATTIGNSKDTITSKTVKAKANVLKLAKKPKLKNYSKYSANFVATKLYYKGKSL